MFSRKILAAGGIALSAWAPNVLAYTITYDVEQKFYNNLGGDTGFFYDAVTLFQRTSTINITDGQTVVAPDFQTVRFDVGNTGPSSAGRLEGFDASRDLTIEGIIGTLHQSGSVEVDAFTFFGASYDELRLLPSDVGFWNLAFGEDRKRLDVQFGGLAVLRTDGTHDIPLTATFYLFNEPDNPIARLAGATVTSGQATTLDGSASDDRDDFGTLVQYAWDLNSDGIYDRTTATSTLALSAADYSSFWSAPGSYSVRLRVADNDGMTDTTMQLVTLLAAPTPPSTVPVPGTLVLLGTSLLCLSYARRKSQR